MIQRMISILALLSILSLPCQAQMGTAKWDFQSRAQVLTALKTQRGNLRGTYNVLICAVRKGYINTAVGFYEQQVLGREFSASAQDSAAFAFARDLADGFRPWHFAKDTDYRGLQKSTLAQAHHFRNRAFKHLPNSPEVLVMRAYWLKYQGTVDDMKNAYEMTVTASKRASNWADAHYWLGTNADFYSMNLKSSNRSKASQIASLGIRSLDRAAKLDPKLHPYSHILRIGLYETIGTKKSAQLMRVHSEAHLKAFPQYGAWYQKRWGKSIQEFRKSNESRARQVEQEAARVDLASRW